MTLRARLQRVIPIAGIAAIAIVYGSTLQTDANGRSISAMIDVGELQISLSSWGTTHSTGYPLYTIVGNLLAELGRLAGIAPAAMTSAISLAASLAAFALLYVFVHRATGQAAAAVTAVLLLLLSPILWLNSIITEVYAINIFLLTLGLYLAWRTAEGDHIPPVALALLLGVMFSHHRTTITIVPAFILLLWQPIRSWIAAWRRPQGPGLPRAVTPLLVAFLAPFALYLYLPLRYIQKATWIYENWRYGLAEPIKLTLGGFLTFESGREYAPYVDIPRTLPQFGARIMELVDMWSSELGVLCLAAGLLGLVVALAGPRRRLALALLLVLFGYCAFGMFYHVKDISSLVTASFIPLVFGAGLLVAWAAERVAAGRPRSAAASVAAWGMTALLVAVPASQLPARYEDMRSITKDPAGREVIRAAQRIPVTCPTVYSLWGIDFFAYNYARLSTREMPCLKVLPLHTDIRQNWQQGERVFVVSHFFYQTTVEQLEQRFGRLYLRSAGFGNVELASAPATAADQEIGGPPTDMGGVITLLGERLQRSADGATLYLTLYWKANGLQRQDYSVFVHVSDKAAIAGPADIVSQSDALHPVYGWYPTSRWVSGEVVRDDYAITENPARPARLIAVGLYQSAGGTFTNLGSRAIAVTPP